MLLTTQDSFTLFAPVNTAFLTLNKFLDKLLTSPWILHLQNLLYYHLTDVGGAPLPSSSLFDGEIVTMVNFENVTINVFNNTITISSPYTANEDSKVIEFDIPATNGIAHKVDAVLLPKFIATDLWQFLKERKEFSTLVSFIKLFPDLITSLVGGDYTILAPTNAAFASLNQSTLDSLDIQDILLYHIIPTVIPSLDFTNGPIETVTGASIQVEIVNATLVTFNNVKAVRLNGLANTGIVHSLAGVLIPPTMNETNTPISTPNSMATNRTTLF